MPALQRSSAPRGARFYEEDGKVMFINVLDATTRFGPREATDEDMAEHPAAFEFFAGGGEPMPPGFVPVVAFDDPPGGKPVTPALKGRKDN